MLREWYLVGKVARAERTLELPAGGTQLFHRVAADPTDFTYGGLARLVAAELGWEWETRRVGPDESDHPWNVRHPVIADTARLREVLGVVDPDPVIATTDQVRWLWERREELMRP